MVMEFLRSLYAKLPLTVNETKSAVARKALLAFNGNCLLTQSVEGDRTNTPDLLNVELI
jgi:hypothetical protein